MLIGSLKRLEKLSAEGLAAEDATGGGEGRLGGSAAAAPRPYLEKEVSTWEREKEGSEWVSGRVQLKKCGCGSVWCGEGCGSSKGLAVRDRLVTELHGMKCPYQIVVTVNRDLFPAGPESAYQWVQQVHALSEFIKRLRRGGWLRDGRYFAVLEFQMKKDREGWPHWHVVVDSTFIPFFEIADAWAAAGWGGSKGKARWGVRPETRIGEGVKPTFGGVRFTLKGSVRGIVRYLTGYLVKQPAEGLPEWVMDTTLQLRRWRSSQNFWQLTAEEKKRGVSFSDLRAKYAGGDDEWSDVEAPELERKERSRQSCRLRHRLSSCGEKTSVLVETTTKVKVEKTTVLGGFVLSPGDTYTRSRWRFVGCIPSAVWKEPTEAGCGGRSIWSRPDDVKKNGFVVSSAEDLRFLSMLLGEDHAGRVFFVNRGEEFGQQWKGDE